MAKTHIMQKTHKPPKKFQSERKPPRPAKYYAETAFGCTIVEARNPQQALNIVRSEVGSNGEPISIRKASKDDLAWVGAMGGRVPE